MPGALVSVVCSNALNRAVKEFGLRDTGPILDKTREFRYILEERRIERAFGDIPKQIRSARETAVNEVFAKEISGLDTGSKEVLEKVLQYMEKKYNAIAMKTAKEAFLGEKEA